MPEAHHFLTTSPATPKIVSPDRCLIRLAANVVIEQDDEWLVGKRYLSNHSLEALLDQENKDPGT